MMVARNELRQMMRARRRAISKKAAQKAAEQLSTRILGLSAIQNCQHIAGYIANDGEISIASLSEKLHTLGKFYYLPALDLEHSNYLIFVNYQPGDKLELNRYEIPEPVVSQNNQRSAKSLDIVLMPLVAFDAQGGRLGMGGGFYDRTFEFIKTAKENKPLLVGMAYECQRVEQVNCEEWDMQLDMIVTEKKIYKK